LKLIYKTQPVSDHVAKFQGDRSRDLGERMAKITSAGGQISSSTSSSSCSCWSCRSCCNGSCSCRSCRTEHRTWRY